MPNRDLNEVRETVNRHDATLATLDARVAALEAAARTPTKTTTKRSR